MTHVKITYEISPFLDSPFALEEKINELIERLDTTKNTMMNLKEFEQIIMENVGIPKQYHLIDYL